MNKIELLETIKKGEDSFTEFKEEMVHQDDLAAGIVAFANTEGGNLIIGVSDKGEVVGVTNTDKEMQRIDNICANNCEPTISTTIEKLIIDDKKLLIVKIPKDLLRSKTKIEGFKKEEPRFEIPIEALREAVINAVAHRNYQLASQIKIFIFDNRIEIKNPGKLPNTATVENIKLGFSLHRNPLITSFLAKEHRMTELGTGIPRIIRLIKEHTGREPEFENREQEFIVRIWRPEL